MGTCLNKTIFFAEMSLKKAGFSKDVMDSIYNIRYVTQTDNRVKLNTPFAEWSKLL